MSPGHPTRRPDAGDCTHEEREVVHEVGIMHQALEIALRHAEQAGGAPIRCIHLRIGVLSGVVEDALRFAFTCLAEGTLAEGGRLAIEVVPMRCFCAACDREYETLDPLDTCPGCAAPCPPLGGQEIEVASLELASHER